MRRLIVSFLNGVITFVVYFTAYLIIGEKIYLIFGIVSSISVIYGIFRGYDIGYNIAKQEDKNDETEDDY